MEQLNEPSNCGVLWKADHAGPDVAVMSGNYLDDVAHLPCLSIVGGSRHVESLRHSPADCLRLSERCAEMTLVCTGIPCASASRVKSNSLSLYLQCRVSSSDEGTVGSPLCIDKDIRRLPTRKCAGVSGSGSSESVAAS